MYAGDVVGEYACDSKIGYGHTRVCGNDWYTELISGNSKWY